MIKYMPETVSVVFEEIPDFVSLAIEITNCPGRCEGCHSPWLRTDIGNELTEEILLNLIKNNAGVNCVVFMGEGKDPEALKALAKTIRKHHPELKTALYSGREEVEDELGLYFDFIKVGPYKAEYGPLNKETTNQRLYEFTADGEKKDITSKFWKKRI